MTLHFVWSCRWHIKYLNNMQIWCTSLPYKGVVQTYKRKKNRVHVFNLLQRFCSPITRSFWQYPATGSSEDRILYKNRSKDVPMNYQWRFGFINQKCTEEQVMHYTHLVSFLECSTGLLLGWFVFSHVYAVTPSQLQTDWWTVCPLCIQFKENVIVLSIFQLTVVLVWPEWSAILLHHALIQPQRQNYTVHKSVDISCV